MASLKVSEFDAAAALTGAELIGLVQGGENVQSTVDDLAAFVAGGAATAELIRDTIGTALAEGVAVTITVNDAGDTITIAAVQEWAPNFTADSDVYIPADVAMTIDQGNAAIGTGTLAFEKSTAAAPSTFSSTTLPAALEAGAWLKVSATGVTGFVATHLKRTA